MRDPLIGVERLYHMHQSKCSTTTRRKCHCRFYGYLSSGSQIMTNIILFGCLIRGPLQSIYRVPLTFSFKRSLAE